MELQSPRVCPHFFVLIWKGVCFAACLAFVWPFPVPPALAAEAPIEYSLDLRNPPSHRVAVTMTVPHAASGLEIQFPAWNALYQIRDFVRGVEHLTAQCDGHEIQLARLDRNTWQVTAERCGTFAAHYNVFINEEGVFSSVLNPDHCYMNLAMLLFYLPRDRNREAHIRFALPDGWDLRTLLNDGPGPAEFTAPDYDTMVDSPVEAAPIPGSAKGGMFHEYGYIQNGANYRVEVFGDPAEYDAQGLIQSLQKITATETGLMHDVPFSRYTFILHLVRGAGGGGMEHRNGTAISVSSEGLKNNLSSLDSVAAHEFFHAWNVKRIRPQNLEPVDYIHGNDTRDLWFSEGVTSTYGELTLLRAGLITRQDFYAHVADEIRTLQRRPARLWQSVETSGREAWLEKYADYPRPERSISYYNKGELLGYLLDLALRHATHAQRSLDDVMRALNTDFAKRGRFFTQADLRDVISTVAPPFQGVDGFFQDYLVGTAELDYETYLGYAGLRLIALPTKQPDPGFHIGRRSEGQSVIQSVDSGSPAEQAGLKPGDVILQLNGRATTDPREEIGRMKAGEQFELVVRRGSRNLNIKSAMGERRETEYRIEEIAQPTSEQLEIRNGWLSGTASSSAIP